MAPLWILTLALDAVAHHEVARRGDAIAVETTWSDREVIDEAGVIALAVPLPGAAVITGATVRTDDDGEIVALVPDDPRARRPHVAVQLEGAGEDALPLPVASRSSVQRVRLGSELAFRPDPALGLVTHLGHTYPLAWHRADRIDVDDRLPGDGRRPGAIYIPTDAITRSGGVLGAVESRTAGRHRTAIAIGGVFVVLCGMGGWAYRRSRHHAEAERADAVLAAEFDALERNGGA